MNAFNFQIIFCFNSYNYIDLRKRSFRHVIVDESEVDDDFSDPTFDIEVDVDDRDDTDDVVYVDEGVDGADVPDRITKSLLSYVVFTFLVTYKFHYFSGVKSVPLFQTFSKRPRISKSRKLLDTVIQHRDNFFREIVPMASSAIETLSHVREDLG